jgi:hypothetical protein
MMPHLVRKTLFLRVKIFSPDSPIDLVSFCRDTVVADLERTVDRNPGSGQRLLDQYCGPGRKGQGLARRALSLGGGIPYRLSGP